MKRCTRRPFIVNQGLDLLNIFDIFRDHRVTSKIPQCFENLDSPLICYQYKNLIRNIIFNYNQVTSNPDILSSIQPSWSCADSPFLYPPAGHVVTGDLTCIPDKGLRSLFEKEPKYRLPSRIDAGPKGRRQNSCPGHATGKMNFYASLT